MTVVALLATRPDETALPGLSETATLSPAETTRLYEAMLVDAMRTIDRSGGELLINYDPGDDEAETKAALRALAAQALADPDEARFEPQVGSNTAAVVGNTVTHLLEQENATTAAMLRPEAPLVPRTMVDSAAMSLRRHEVVLGPAADGRLYYAGFREPIDFENAFSPPAAETVATRGADAGYDIDFEPQHTLVDTPADLRSVLALLQSRRRSGVPVPSATAALVDDLGLVAAGDETLSLDRR